MILDFFCTVIDNLGDAGYTIRLASALYKKGFTNIRIFTDYIDIFNKIKPKNYPDTIEIHDFNSYHGYTSGDVVIGMFQFYPNEEYIKEINKKAKKYLIVDYFTPEDWAIEANGNMSFHDGLKVPITFFVPGLYEGTAGILMHSDTDDETVSIHNIYLYEFDHILNMLEEAGIESKDINVWNKRTEIITQEFFDAYVFGSKYSWIRGEDSLQVALWAGKPFFWQAYRQKNKIHMLKVKAFLKFLSKFFNSEEEKEIFKKYSEITLWLNDPTSHKSETQIFEFIDKRYSSLSGVFENLTEYFITLKSLQDTLTENIV